MSPQAGRPRVTIALPVFNGGDTVSSVIESVLAQTCSDIELVISDNGSSDHTQEVCREYARADERIVYQRHASDIGLLRNFQSAAERGTGTHLRWLGDDDWLDPEYVDRVLDAFAADERTVLVTTQITYVDPDGFETLTQDYDPTLLASPDAVVRLREALRMVTGGYALVDPLYGTLRRDLALLPRGNIVREDEVFAARLALAGPWAHVHAPLARRHRSQGTPRDWVRLLGLPGWHRYAADVLQYRELADWIERSDLDPRQRRLARRSARLMYARRKRNKAIRGLVGLERWIGPRLPARTTPSGAR